MRAINGYGDLGSGLGCPNLLFFLLTFGIIVLPSYHHYLRISQLFTYVFFKHGTGVTINYLQNYNQLEAMQDVLSYVCITEAVWLFSGSVASLQLSKKTIFFCYFAHFLELR